VIKAEKKKEIKSCIKSIWRVVREHAFYATGMTYRLTKMAERKTCMTKWCEHWLKHETKCT